MISQLYSLLLEHVDGAPKVDTVYRPLITIGEGRFAKVKLCYHMEEKAFYAIKLLKKGFSLSELRAFVAEVDVLSRLASLTPHVPKIIDANFKGEYHRPGSQPIKTCYYVMQLAEYGELFGLVKNGSQLNEDCVRLLFCRILEAVESVHQASIFHRDLKLENLLIDQDFRVKLCDFGSHTEGQAESLSQRRLGGALGVREDYGTLAFNAPEVHLGHASKPDKADVFSLGCALFLLAFRQHPFKTAKREDLLFKTLQTCPDQYWPIFKNHVSDDLKGKFKLTIDLLRRCLAKDPEERIALYHIKHHPWMLQKPTKSNSEILEDLKLAYSEVTHKFLEQATEEIKRRDWKRFKGFTTRRSRPGSACDFKKEITDFLSFHQTELDSILVHFKRPKLRKITEDFEEFQSRKEAITPTKPPYEKEPEIYSITKMLRQYSSSSSSESSSR